MPERKQVAAVPGVVAMILLAVTRRRLPEPDVVPTPAGRPRPGRAPQPPEVKGVGGGDRMARDYGVAPRRNQAR